MIDRQLVEKKLRKIEQFLKEIKSIDVLNFEDFKNNIILKRFIERNIELAVEQMIDVCKHLVSILDLKEPETYGECFDILSVEKIILSENINIFKSMIRFRNLLIHSYDEVDESIVFGIYKNHLNDFKLFIANIREYLKRF